MANLDSLEEIGRLDSQNVLSSIDELPKQLKHAWEEAEKVNVPESYKDIDNVLMCGMGGSGLGARIIESVYISDLGLPLKRINTYELPAYANERSLVICSSYSGTTEETISNAQEAVERKCKWMAIGTGNTLLDLASQHNVPYYKIEAKFNPSNQPRMAIGYSVIGQLVLASKAGLFEIGQEEVEKVENVMQQVIERNNVNVVEQDNPAKQLARKYFDKDIVFISASHMVGATHTINNQLNENAKVFSADYVIPELNHHLMEGLKHPTQNTKRLFAFFVTSDLYPERITQRMEITRDVAGKNNIDNYVYKVTSETKLSQTFELIQFGAYVNFYLAMLYRQDPAPIPWVDYFKQQLGQPLGK